MRYVSCLLFTAVTFLSLSPAVYSQEPAAKVLDGKSLAEAFKESYYFTAQSGSNLSLAVFKLLEKKHPELSAQFKINSAALQHSLSQYSLRSGYFGELLQSRTSSGFGSEIDLITGKHAVNESLQLGSIDPAQNRWRPTPVPGDELSSIDISLVEPVQVKSHPWHDMLREVSPTEQSPVLRLIPQDDFFVHFDRMEKLSELEGALSELVTPAQHVLNAGSLLNLKQKVTDRLGIRNPDVFEPLVKEVAFVSEDFDFYPATNFALILNFKAEFLSDAGQYLSKGVSTSEKVGDFLVIATSSEFLNKIKATYETPQNSMLEADELKYTSGVLDKRRDGLMYLSEKFIRKLVSPAYRIQAARRNAVLNRLEALQYTVLAYRVLNGRFPSSFEQMNEAGYIDQSGYTAEYTIEPNGQVRHAVWGGLRSTKPISEVPLLKVSAFEKQRYDSFRNGYQSFWREFFDPVGVAITVSDRIYFHTIILPLIDNSEYRALKSFLGGLPKNISGITKDARHPAFTLHLTFDFDSMLIENMGTVLSYDRMRTLNSQTATLAEKKAAINNELQEKLKFSAPFDIFGILGDEISIGFGEKQPILIKNLADVDAFVGFKLRDQDRFKKFINQIYSQIYRDLKAGAGGGQFFQLSSEEPLKNEYNGVTFHLIPAGFTNLFYVFIDDKVYFTISQLAINRLIDGFKTGESLPANNRRSIDYLGSEQNVLLLADFSQAQQIKEDLSTQSARGYYVDKKVRDVLGYLADVDLYLRATGEDKDNLKHYFPWLPEESHGIKVSYDNKRIRLGDKKILVNEIDFKSFPIVTYGINQTVIEGLAPKTGVKIDNLLDPNVGKSILNAWEKVKGFGIGLKFTEHGLDTRVAFSNPKSTTVDDRFQSNLPHSKPQEFSGNSILKWQSKYFLGLLLSLGLIIALFLWGRGRSSKL